MFEITENMKNLESIFSGYEIRFVGGCVRDFVMKNTPKDYDFCTTATPEQMIAIGNKYTDVSIIPTGIDHGTISFVIGDDVFEVTTLRTDESSDGRHAEVQYVSSFEEDAKRRDFTMNAMSMDFDGNIYDYFYGQKDIKNKKLRFVGKTRERITEDYLRILRAYRFSITYKMEISNFDVWIMQTECDNLKNISIERWWLELNKILSCATEEQIFMMENILNSMGLETHGMTRFYARSINFSFPPANSNSLYKLAYLIPDMNQFENTWKLSTKEMDELKYYHKNLYFNFNPDDIFHNYLYDKKFMIELTRGIPKEWISQLYLPNRWRGKYFIDSVREIPVFPLRGQDFIDAGHKPGKDIGKMLSDARLIWENFDFQPSKEFLLNK